MLLHFYLLSAAGVVGLGPIHSFLFFTVLSIVALAKLLNLLIRQEKHLFRAEEIFLGN